MKKFLITLIAFLTLTVQTAIAQILPRYSYNIQYPGIGAFNPPYSFDIYTEPSEDAEIIKTINWSKKGLVNEEIPENDLFVVFLPGENIAYCAVDDEIDGWVKIYYSQAHGYSGWVKTTQQNRFISWKGFFMFYGRKNGVYFFQDMPKLNKRLSSAPETDSQKIDDITYPRFIKLTLVRGNWMLVKLLDIGDEVKVGWIKWRNEDGRFMIFPRMVPKY